MSARKAWNNAARQVFMGFLVLTLLTGAAVIVHLILVLRIFFGEWSDFNGKGQAQVIIYAFFRLLYVSLCCATLLIARYGPSMKAAKYISSGRGYWPLNAVLIALGMATEAYSPAWDGGVQGQLSTSGRWQVEETMSILPLQIARWVFLFSFCTALVAAESSDWGTPPSDEADSLDEHSLSRHHRRRRHQRQDASSESDEDL